MGKFTGKTIVVTGSGKDKGLGQGILKAFADEGANCVVSDLNIDAEAGTIDVEVSEAELDERRKAWQPRETDYASGTLWKYAQTVGSAEKGAVTHPGGKAEKTSYADL